jgi:hypothetical protein
MGGVKVRVLSGPYAGGLYEPDGATPLELLESFMQHRWQWQLFYVPDAEPAEIQDWLQADLLVRVMQAMYDGRGIRFAGHRWQNHPRDKDGGRSILWELTAEMERAGAFRLLADDPDGDLVLGLAADLDAENPTGSTGTDPSD